MGVGHFGEGERIRETQRVWARKSARKLRGIKRESAITGLGPRLVRLSTSPMYK